MYKPPDDKNPQYPVFAKVNGRIIPWISPKRGIALVVVVLVSSVLFLDTGEIKQTIDTPLVASQKTLIKEKLKAQRSAIDYQQIKADMTAYEDNELARPNLTLDEKSKYQELSAALSRANANLITYEPDQREQLSDDGIQAGLNKDTTDDEIDAMVPQTTSEQVPVIDDLLRFVLCVLMPVGITLILILEIGGAISGTEYLKDRFVFYRKQKTYFYRRAEVEYE